MEGVFHYHEFLMKTLGERLRLLRNNKGWTIEALAEETGLSMGYISQVERDKSSLSIVSLSAICEALGVEMQDVLTDLPPTSPQGVARFITTEDTQMHFQIANADARYTYLSGSFADRALDGMQARFPPHYAGKETTHPGEEFGYILNGVVFLTLKGQTYRLKTGDSYQFMAYLPHIYSTREEPAEVLWVSTDIKLLEHLRNAGNPHDAGSCPVSQGG